MPFRPHGSSRTHAHVQHMAGSGRDCHVLSFLQATRSSIPKVLNLVSQPANLDLAVAEFNSFIRGYHIYRHIWDPAVGELLILEREPNSVMHL